MSYTAFARETDAFKRAPAPAAALPGCRSALSSGRVLGRPAGQGSCRLFFIALSTFTALPLWLLKVVVAT